MSVSRRSWNGFDLDVISAHCTGRVSHHLCYESHTRICAVLEEVGSVPSEPRLRPNQPCTRPPVARQLQFAPAGMDLWGYGADMRYVRDAVLSFDLKTAEARFQQTFPSDIASVPRLRFADDRLWMLMKMLADVVDDRDPSTQLFGEGLIAAIVATLMRPPAPRSTEVTRLAPWQLRRVVEYLDAHISERVELATLAALVGLSQSHFSHAFRATTGVAPYRWQLEARIRRAKQLLLETQTGLEQIAAATGFADAVHFGRTFRRLTGVPPAAWRRDRQSHAGMFERSGAGSTEPPQG